MGKKSGGKGSWDFVKKFVVSACATAIVLFLWRGASLTTEDTAVGVVSPIRGIQIESETSRQPLPAPAPAPLPPPPPPPLSTVSLALPPASSLPAQAPASLWQPPPPSPPPLRQPLEQRVAAAQSTPPQPQQSQPPPQQPSEHKTSATAVAQEVAVARPEAPAGNRSLHTLPVPKGCTGCCNKEDSVVACLNVEQCAVNGPVNGKYALALSHYGTPNEGMLGSIQSMKDAAEMLGNTDILMVMQKSDVAKMTPKIEKLFRKWGVKLYEVPWDVPPDMLHYPKTDWCGHQDLIRMHVLAIEGYDAVAYFDGDVEFQGDVTPVMRCAATGKFLSTNGGIGEALNVGFFALRPDKRMLEAARIFARENKFSQETGWGQMGWKPNGGYYVGGECGQGFFYTLFYKSGPPARRALEGAGVWDNGVFESAQIDRCIWNYQTSYQCRADLDCTKVRVHHKPTRERGSDPHECEKLKIRERRKELARRKKLDRKPPTPEELAAAQEGQLLKHSGGLCVRPADETFTQDDSNLVLMDCHEPPTEQNIRLVAVEGGDEDEEGSVVLLKQGGSCGHMESDEDPEMMPREPKILFPMDCDSTKHVMTFKKLEHKTLAGAFLLKHSSGNCVHPFEGAEKPKPSTGLILHSDCNQGRPALAFEAEAPKGAASSKGSKPAAAPAKAAEKRPEEQPREKKAKKVSGNKDFTPAQLEEPCEYMKSNPQSSRPGKPCIPPAPFWPYKSQTIWRIELGTRILAAVTPKVTEADCKGTYLYGDVAWCTRAFDSQSPGKALLGLSYGIEERDIWSEMISNQKMLPTKLYDCFIPPERSLPMSGKAPNATRTCKGQGNDGVEGAPCYTTKYEAYQICLGSEATVKQGKHFETLADHLRGLPPLSVHLKIDTEGSEWSVLDQLVSSPEDMAKIRTLDMEVHFNWMNAGDPESVKAMSVQSRLEWEVGIMERLLEKFHCTGSTLEVYRQGWAPQDNCATGECNEPPVYLAGGFSTEMFAVSYVNKEILA